MHQALLLRSAGALFLLQLLCQDHVTHSVRGLMTRQEGYAEGQSYIGLQIQEPSVLVKEPSDENKGKHHKPVKTSSPVDAMNQAQVPKSDYDHHLTATTVLPHYSRRVPREQSCSIAYQSRQLTVLLIGGIPIVVLTTLSAIMAIDSHKPSQQGTITRRMTTIEEMEGTDVLCNDKTRTLTLNKLIIDRNLIKLSINGMEKEHVILLTPGSLGLKIRTP
ncbi:hypothetical protein AAG906_019008 [Vitis piasezkii]